MYTLATFYKSREWESFRRVLIAERTDSSGFVRCAHCGEPITKKYDLIIHHVIELTETNCNDAAIAFNPDNCVCVHFRCHNAIHDRWQGGYRAKPKQVYIVYGAPLSGKSTWVNESMGYGDMVADLDSIWECVTGKPRYVKPDKMRGVVFQMWERELELIRYRSGKWNNAYVITGGAVKADRKYLFERVNADEYIFIDTPKETCLERLRWRSFDSCKPWGKPKKMRDEWESYIEQWFNDYSR